MKKRVQWNGKATDVSQTESGEWLVFTEKGLITVSDEEFQASQEIVGEEHADMWESAFEDGRHFIDEDDYDYINNFVKVTDGR